eukprot:gnl/MRDRNA2_/MRDRNA2_100124_c0_seq1.p1 gnl/MRDRNA2_/MRDRNA2_100124_c0~~gnl/MRDRNA2_/MRDRNA2_100124_c0_seq1.p1  ORF type:complete len:323 (-),score=65.18 gnl/MRDRNA2_/MRDRNA2_100124_c0_seq1:315-1202(-)
MVAAPVNHLNHEEDNPVYDLKTDNVKNQLARLQAILNRFEISIAEANDLTILEDYEIVIIADDSGSMSCPAAPASQRTLGVPAPTRWDELKETLALMVDLGNCFDSSGVDIHFLNRLPISNVKSSGDPAFIRAFNQPPQGGTPLTETLRRVTQKTFGDKPILLIILTDGVPNGGPNAFGAELRKLVKKQSTHVTYKVQIMACTSDDDAIGYLNDLDAELKEVDVTDDYYSERAEVMKARRVSRFTRGDWCMKAMLGPVSTKFDLMDETYGHPFRMKRSATAQCEHCNLSQNCVTM